MVREVPTAAAHATASAHAAVLAAPAALACAWADAADGVVRAASTAQRTAACSAVQVAALLAAATQSVREGAWGAAEWVRRVAWGGWLGEWYIGLAEAAAVQRARLMLVAASVASALRPWTAALEAAATDAFWRCVCLTYAAAAALTRRAALPALERTKLMAKRGSGERRVMVSAANATEAVRRLARATQAIAVNSAVGVRTQAGQAAAACWLLLQQTAETAAELPRMLALDGAALRGACARLWRDTSLLLAHLRHRARRRGDDEPLGA
jgi:hypothetical protein